MSKPISWPDSWYHTIEKTLWGNVLHSHTNKTETFNNILLSLQKYIISILYHDQLNLGDMSFVWNSRISSVYVITNRSSREIINHTFKYVYNLLLIIWVVHMYIQYIFVTSTPTLPLIPPRILLITSSQLHVLFSHTAKSSQYCLYVCRCGAIYQNMNSLPGATSMKEIDSL